MTLSACMGRRHAQVGWNTCPWVPPRSVHRTKPNRHHNTGTSRGHGLLALLQRKTMPHHQHSTGISLSG